MLAATIRADQKEKTISHKEFSNPMLVKLALKKIEKEKYYAIKLLKQSLTWRLIFYNTILASFFPIHYFFVN